MSKREQTILPMSQVRFDFADSLEELCDSAMQLHITLATALDLGKVDASVAARLQTANERLKAALVSVD